MNAKLGSDGRLTLPGWLLNQLDLSGFAWRTKNLLCDEFAKSQKPVMLNLIQHPYLRQTGHKIKDLRDPETILNRVQHKVQGDRLELLTNPSLYGFFPCGGSFFSFWGWGCPFSIPLSFERAMGRR